MPLPLRRAAARRSSVAVAGVLTVAALALTGCSQVAIIKSAPVAAASYDSHLGNDPLAAADAASLQAALRSRGQDWTITIATQPAAAGNVNVTNLSQLVAARGKVRDFAMTLTTPQGPTLQGFSSRGAQGEQAYLESLVQAVAGAGYGRVTSVRIDVYFDSSHHAVLTWKATTGFVYNVLDGKP